MSEYWKGICMGYVSISVVMLLASKDGSVDSIQMIFAMAFAVIVYSLIAWINWSIKMLRKEKWNKIYGEKEK